jgi:hypothetical protein
LSRAACRAATLSREEVDVIVEGYDQGLARIMDRPRTEGFRLGR